MSISHSLIRDSCQTRRRDLPYYLLVKHGIEDKHRNLRLVSDRGKGRKDFGEGLI